MSQPYRHQQQQQAPPVEDGPIPFFGGGGGNAPPAHRAGPPPRPIHQGFNNQYQHQQQQQQQPRPPQPQRHPQQHPQPFPQAQGQQQFQAAQLAPFQQSQQQPPAPAQQLNASELAPAADLFASPPTANRQLQHGPPRTQGYQPQAVSDIFGTPQQRTIPQQGQQQSQPAPQQIQQRIPPQQQSQQSQPGYLAQRPGQQPPFQRHPHHPVPISQPFQGYESTSQPQIEHRATSFGSTMDLFGAHAQKAPDQTISPQVTKAATGPPPVNTTSTTALQLGQTRSPISGGSQARGRPPLPPAPLLEQRPSLTPQAQHTPSAPPLPNQRQQIGNQSQQQQQQQQSHSRQASISAQAPPPQRYGLGAQRPQGIQQQPSQPFPGQAIAQQQSFSRASPGTPRHGPVFGPPSGSPHTSYVQPRTPLLSATQAASIAPGYIAQSQQSTPSLTHTPYMGPYQSQFGSTTNLLLQPCPFSECAGENKPQAKFCSECGRSIGMASRSATPSLSHRADFIPTQPSPQPSLDRQNSYSQEKNRFETFQSTEHQEQAYPQQEYSQEGQQWNAQGYDASAYQVYEQQQYDPNTGYHADQQYAPQQEQIVPEQELEIAEPEPERIDDPLNRQSGCPLIAFGFGGRVMTWFPSVERATSYNPGNLGTIHNPRALTLRHITDRIPADTAIANFPGPLLMDSSVQMKSKLKDVSKLIEDKINGLGQVQEDNEFDAHRVLIWKLFKVMIEQEGTLVGGAKIDEAVRSVLQSIPFTKILSSPVQQESSEQISVSIDALQEMLRQGDLEASVRQALDSRLWAHALIISSHGDGGLWKEAVNCFVKHELSSGNLEHANGRESLRVLYKLFSGQPDRAVSELVPDSLRAQYLEDVHSLSKHAKIPDDSLAQWRDTLTLILSNRTEGDQEAIHALGDMLVKEGWVEAGHICYLLSPQVSVHSGPDTPHVSMVLLGAEHNPHSSFPYYKNVDAFQRTEIYEFACALKSSGATGGLPFLQAYKLVYVWSLLDDGMISEAGRYLESVETIVKSQTKGSPYYNTTFFSQLNDVTERLAAGAQSAHAGSWLSKKAHKPVTESIFDSSEHTPLDNASSHKQAELVAATTTDMGDVPQNGFSEESQHVDFVLAGAKTTDGAQDTAGHYGGDSYTQPDLNIGYEHDGYDSQQQAYDATQSFGADYSQVPVADKQDREHYNQAAGYYESGQDQDQTYTYGTDEVQDYDQYEPQNIASEHKDDGASAAPESILSTQAVAGSEKRSDDALHGTAPSHEMQDSGYDGAYVQYSENSGYEYSHQETAHYAEGQYQEQPQHADGEAHVYGETVTYETSTQYYQEGHDSEHAQYSGVGAQGVGAKYHELYPQNAEGHTVEGTTHQQQQYIANQEPAHVDTVLADEPTLEQLSGASLEADGAADGSHVYAIQDAQDQQGEQLQAEEPTSEYHHTGYENAGYEQAEHQQHGGYDQQAYAQDGYQQVDYQHGEYQQGEHQQSEHQQDEHQQGEHQQSEYEQGEYRQREYQQGEYQQGEYQQGEYQQGDYQDAQYQGSEYAQAGYQHGGYQQGGYQLNDYYQQSSTEPGVLPVSSEEDQNTTDFVPAVASTKGVQELQEGDYEEGQFISFGAVPSFPTFGGQQHATHAASPIQHQQYQQNAEDDMDDLGMGNSALRKDKPAAPGGSTDGNTGTSDAQQSADAGGQNGQESDEAPKTWWPKIGLFSAEKRAPSSKPVEASLGEGSSFYYDKELQKWVNKDADPEDQASAGPLPPPPKAHVSTPASPLVTAAGPHGGLPGGPPGGLPTSGSPSVLAPPQARPGAGPAARRGARARYVDVLNP